MFKIIIVISRNPKRERAGKGSYLSLNTFYRIFCTEEQYSPPKLKESGKTTHRKLKTGTPAR